MKSLAMTCQEIQDELSDYFDEALDPSICAELERHLNGCENCRIVVDTLEKTILLYRDYGPTPVPDGAQERLVRVLKLERRAADVKRNGESASANVEISAYGVQTRTSE